MSPQKTSIAFTVAALFLLGNLSAADTPSPALLVLNKEESSLAIVDPASGKVVARIPTGEGPHEVTASTDGKLAFVGNYGARTPGSTISVIDLAAQKELRRVDLGSLRRPHGITFADGKVYFTAEVNKLIGRYDPSSDHIDWLLGTGQNGTHMVLVSKYTDRIFTANIGSDTISVIERASGPLDWNETQISVGKGPEAIDISPDGKELWTAHSRDGGVSIIDIASKKVIETFNIATKRSNRLKFTPDGKRVLISDLEGGELVVLDRADRKQVKRMKLGRSPEGILIPPEASRAYVAVAGDNHVAIIDLKTLEVTGHISTGSGPDGMAWAQPR
ncbi:MAG: beta-propeller repeat protein [Bryobacterales bacterium]|nr:beta-propeller repeat protein [Bryobacterales bacterium]